MSKILSGKIIKKEIKESLKEKLSLLDNRLGVAIIKVGNREDSNTYIKNKEKFADEIGVDFYLFEFEERTSEDEIIKKIKELNSDKKINGIILQLPIPKYLDKEMIIEAIDYKKDIDGLTPENQYRLVSNKKGLIPATARGVLTLLDYYDYNLEGANAIVMGRSVLAGKSIALAMLNRNATVMVAHSHTKDLDKHIKQSEILVVATGVLDAVRHNWVHKGLSIIDVGIHTTDNIKKKFRGDVDLESVAKKTKAITPVPGGVGQLTVACLFENLFDAYKWQEGVFINGNEAEIEI